MSPAPINAVVTAFAVIEHLTAARGPLRVSQLARSMQAGRALVYRHLQTLVELGYCRQEDGSDRYMLTPRLACLGQSITQQIPFVQAVTSVMPALADQLHMTVSAGQPDTDGVRIVEIVRHRSKIEISIPVGSIFEFTSSAHGRAALAFTPGLAEREMLKSGSPSLFPPLSGQLALVRQTGWAASRDEVMPGISAIAAPVFDAQSSVAGTLAVSAPNVLLRENPDPELIDALLRAARRASNLLAAFQPTQSNRKRA